MRLVDPEVEEKCPDSDEACAGHLGNIDFIIPNYERNLESHRTNRYSWSTGEGPPYMAYWVCEVCHDKLMRMLLRDKPYLIGEAVQLVQP